MEAIWMVIVVIVLVLQAVSKISGSNGKQPRRWEPVKLPGQGRTKEPRQAEPGDFPPVLKDWEFSWDDSQWGEAASIEQLSQNERPKPEEPKEAFIRSEPSPDRSVNPENQGGHIEYGPERGLNREDILNGLIFSELLQPPKCKRKR